MRHNPVDSVQMLREQEKQPRPYSEDELERLMAELPADPREVAFDNLEVGVMEDGQPLLKPLSQN